MKVARFLCDLGGFSLRPLRFKSLDRLSEVKPYTAKHAKKAAKDAKNVDRAPNKRP